MDTDAPLTQELRLSTEGTARQQYYFRQFLEAARGGPWDRLRGLQAGLWARYGEGLLTDGQAGYVAEIVTARLKPAETPAEKPPRDPATQVGTRPIGPDSLARRRRLSRETFVHPQDTGDLTNGEMAVLTVVTEEILKAGRCTLPVGKLAALAGISRRWAQHALAKLAALAFVVVERRPGERRRHDTNVVTLHPLRQALKARLAAVKTWWRGRGALWSTGRTLAHATRLKKDKRHPRAGDNTMVRAPPAPGAPPGRWSARPVPS